jgi:hypothetical protein
MTVYQQDRWSRAAMADPQGYLAHIDAVVLKTGEHTPSPTQPRCLDAAGRKTTSRHNRAMGNGQRVQRVIFDLVARRSASG